MRISNCSAVVTGGASGLGRAAVDKLHGAGARVVIMDLPGSPGQELAQQLGDNAEFVAGDVTVPADVERAVETAVALAPLRVAVAAAGIGPPVRLFGRDGVIGWDKAKLIIDVNVIGTYNLLSHASHAMSYNEPEDQERGVVICTASIAAYEGQVGQVAYAASKGAVVSLTLPAARELAGHAIRVMTVAPGLFDTPLMASMPEKAKLSVAAQVPHPARLGAPAEYAALLEHIVLNPMLNGEVIRLDGAIRMAPK
ncbi:NAD(P)-dependent dehydrogenase (short-subunit alcohol dehydrogenase family) [Arthrobacter sp. V1I7]|uniref:SDR family NAD(P)-dependent oxidoreductase n=1 Tax=Arthrobacter sp. V1I7 TaxID=3042274 RepID=UPI002785BA27|nr:SDR family NAD(P)-dependent oxidoreductase [Arthrobacter sp. V1I7]MDQ0823774.1 NAD(P)-dependent dehydrogenase (short-subunit alcohol dehydrogenase family) [Arthrobacter sp. V1I7]